MKKLIGILIAINCFIFSSIYFFITKPKLMSMYKGLSVNGPHTLVADIIYFALILLGCIVLYWTFRKKLS